jgi:hypothetical protein
MSRAQTKARPAMISCAGALTSLALHLLLMTPVLMGFGTSTQRPLVDSSELESPAEDDPSSSMTVTFIDEPDSGIASQGGETSARLAASPPLNSVPLPAPAPKFNLPVDDDTDAGHDKPNGSGRPDPGRQLLFGRYIGQITARIERAWMRPRTPIENPFFACRVRIIQNRSGVVQEVELVRCNGDSRWQTSLVEAIQTASPLPAPPDADVFTGQLTLDLQSAAFTPDGSAEGFEPGASVAAIGK